MATSYDHGIPAWMDSTEGLSDGAYRAYHVILQLIMLNEGPIAQNERAIAGRCNQTLKTFSRNLAELLAARKLMIVDGRIAKWRANSPAELVSIAIAYAARQGSFVR